MKTLTKPDLLSAMQKHAIGVSEIESLAVPESREEVKLLECKFCLGIFMQQGHGEHEKACILNPHRDLGILDFCSFCGVSMSVKGLWKHEETCDGDTEAVLDRFAKEDIERLRKAKTFRDQMINMRSPKVAEVELPSETVEDLVLQDILDMMEERVENSHRITVREFSDWYDMTVSLFLKA